MVNFRAWPQIPVFFPPSLDPDQDYTPKWEITCLEGINHHSDIGIRKPARLTKPCDECVCTVFSSGTFWHRIVRATSRMCLVWHQYRSAGIEGGGGARQDEGAHDHPDNRWCTLL